MMDYFLMPHPPIIVPEVGKGNENAAINTVNACKAVGDRIEALDAETIIIVSPHGTIFRDAVAMITSSRIKGDLGRFGAPKVSFQYNIDMELTDKIINEASGLGIPVAGLDEQSSLSYGVPLELDHGAIVPLYYADKSKSHKLVHITYGMLSPVELLKFGMAVKKAVDSLGRKAVFIASGDLSHRLIKDGPYEYSPLGAEFDNTLIERLSEGSLKAIFKIDKKLINESGQCGLRSLYIMAGAIGTSTAPSSLLSYEGPFGVGYGIMEFKEGKGNLYDDLIADFKAENRRKIEEGNPYTRLARKNLSRYFEEGVLMTKDEVKDISLLDDKKGVFVSLKINGELRGCIGTIEPAAGCIAEEIICNSISAALNDPRFQPLKKEELYECDISVDLLYPPEPASMEDLNPSEYGVIVSCGNRRGLLLPNLEGVNTREQQVEIAMNKGNISQSEDYSLQRFRVERFEEDGRHE